MQDKVFIPLIIICFIMGGGGILGGMASTLIENLYESSTQASEAGWWCKIKKYFFHRGVIGIIGAVVAVFTLFSVDKVKINLIPDNLFLVICVSIIGGAFCKKILWKAQNDLNRLMNAQSIELTNLVQSGVNYSIVTQTDCDTLIKPDMLSIDIAITKTKEILPSYPKDRLLNIYLGRLYRKKGDLLTKIPEKLTNYNQAIITLRNFIELLDVKIEVDRANKADALYNIACYHVLQLDLVGSSKKRQINLEIKSILQQSLKMNPSNKRYAVVDSDLKPLAKKTWFTNLVKKS